MQTHVPWYKRVWFTGAARIEIYEMLALMLENRMLLIDALREIRGVVNAVSPKAEMAAGRTKPGHVDDVKLRTVSAEAVHSWILHLKAGDADGMPLSKAIGPWVPQEEAALIQSGEMTGDLSGALADAVEGIQNKGAMFGAVAAGTVYPIMLFVGSYFMLRIMATKVVPRFESQMDPELWEGAARALYVVATAFNRFGLAAAIAAVLGTVLAVLSLPYYRGPGRVFLDRSIPPWNLYKMVQGTTFLRNVALQTRAGIKLIDSVGAMAKTGSPWLRERLEAAQYGLQQGQNLGEALYRAEYQFPDKKSVQILRALASRDGFDETIYRFAKRWQQDTLKRVKGASSVLLVAGILMIAGVIAVTIGGIQGLTVMIQDEADAVSSGVRR